jgi:GT2 family glycosyltransferase
LIKAESQTESPPPAGDDSSVAVILINWNDWKDTIAAIESIEASDFKSWKVFIVDNASVDDSVSKLSDLGPNCILLESKDNLGFAGGCNLGAQVAKEQGIPYLFFLNNDAKVESETLSHLVGTSRTLNNDAILGAVVRYFPSGEIQFLGSSRSSLYGTPNWYPGLESELCRHGDLIETDFVFGAAMFVPTNLWKTLGSFDEKYFLNFEETDWCYRASDSGHRCLIVKSAIVHHKANSSIGGFESPIQIYFMQRNRLLFCERHGTPRQIWRAYRNAFNHLIDRFSQARRATDTHRSMKNLQFRATILAVKDYVLRRFGDCPDIVRKLARDYRDLEAAGRTPASEQES